MLRYPPRFMLLFRFVSIGLAVVGLLPAGLGAPAPQSGEPVRLVRGETLYFEGKKIEQAGKGQEFTLLRTEPGKAFLSFARESGESIAVTVPTDAIEPVPPAPWEDLLRGMRAFRDQQYDAARTLLARAAQDKEQQAMVNALAARVNGAIVAAGQASSSNPAARAAFIKTIGSLRDAADQLAKAGRNSLALAMDEGADRLGAALLGGELPPTKINRLELAPKVATAERCYLRARQAFGARRLVEARRLAAEGLTAEPGHTGMKALQPAIKRGLTDADELYETANKMKRFEKGAIHALSAIDDGLKICIDHPRLRELRNEMAAQFEERTSPRVTSAFLAAAKAPQGSIKNLEEGRNLYTNRCAECHELEMLDNRSIGGWERMVDGMARRANLGGAEKARIMEYLSAALKVVEAGGQ